MASAESGRSEQIIGNFFLKALQIILDSRVPYLLSGSRIGGEKARRKDRWFNLALGDPPAALESLGFWHRSVSDPMIVDVLLLRDAAADSESIIERWTVQYEQLGASSDSSGTFYKKTYKKCIILLRSIYAILRLLPAYKPFQLLSAATAKNLPNLPPHRHNQNQNCNFNLSYRVSSFSQPFSRAEEEEMKHHDFAAVETQFGQISVSVVYRHDLAEFNLESSSLFPPRIITDYVGSPGAGSSITLPSSLPSSEGFVVPSSSPARTLLRFGSGPISRPHSWTSSPMAHHPHHYPTSTFKDYAFSPPFSPSPSPSPSPPTRSVNPLHRRLHSETAPVMIPSPSIANSPNLTLPPPSPRISRAENSSEDSPETRSFRRVEGFRLSDLQKGFRDDSGRFSGVLSSCGGSPRVGFSRSSSKLSLQDDLDDSCPFAVDDVDVPDSQRRSIEGKAGPDCQLASSWTSQEAAVGMLVHMLRSAPPLRQDLGSSRVNPGSNVDRSVDQSVDLSAGGASSFYASRRASDAIEELQGYKQIKDMLLSRSGSHSASPARRER